MATDNSAATRLKSRPAPAPPLRKHSSYNFKATDPASLLTSTDEIALAPSAISPLPPAIPLATPLIAPAAQTSPSATPGQPPRTPFVHPAATHYTPPVPPNLDLAEIASPVPLRPNLRGGTSYNGSISSSLPVIPETRAGFTDAASHSSRASFARQRRNSGFFDTFSMDGVEDMPILGRRRSRSNSSNYDETWPLPPVQVVERGLNTPGEPRRSSLIQQEQIDAAIRDSARNASIAAVPTPSCPKAKSGLEALERLTHGDGCGSSSDSANTSTATSKDSSSTNLTDLTLPSLCPQTSLSIIDEGASFETPDKSLFVFDESFVESINRKRSQNLSPHTRPNSPEDEAVISQPTLTEMLQGPITEAEHLILADGPESHETDDDYHSIRSHMTRVTTLGAGSVIYNMSMATPNMALPTPEELRADHERKEKLRAAYMKMNAGQARSGSEESALGAAVQFGIEGAMRAEAEDPTPEGWLDKVRSVGYPFPRTKSDKKGKGKEKDGPLSTPKSNTSPRSVFARIDIFKSKETKAREQAEREAAEAEAAKVRDYQRDIYNRKVDIGSSIAESDSQAHHGPYRSPWIEPDTEHTNDKHPVHTGARLPIAGDSGAGPSRRLEACTKKGVEELLQPRCVPAGNSFHDNFATSSSGSAHRLATSSDMNYVKNLDGPSDEMLPLGQCGKEVVTVEDFPSIPAGQFSTMSSALVKDSTLGSRHGSCFNDRFTGPTTETMPRQLSHEDAKIYDGSSSSSGSDETDYANDTGRSMKVDNYAAHDAKKVKDRLFTRPGMQSRVSTVRDLDVRRASTVEISRSGDTHTRIVTQEARSSLDSSIDEGDRRLREAKLRKLASRKRSMLGSKKSTTSAKKKSEAPRSSEEGSPNSRRRLSAALQGGFGGNRMQTDGQGGIVSTADIPLSERPKLWGRIVDKFRRGEKNDDIDAERRVQRPTLARGITTADGADGAGEELLRKKTSWWRRRVEVDPMTGRIPRLKRIQEAIKRGNSTAIPQPKVPRVTVPRAGAPLATAQAPTA